MINKKIIASIILLIFLLSTVSTSFAEDDRSYSINQALIDLTVQTNGLLHVQESYDYSFTGTYHGVYRDIPLKSGESIENLNVTTEGAYSDYKITNDENGNKKVTVYLYSDAAKTKPINDCDVTVNINYDFKNVVTLYKDTASLQYKIWGDQWDVDVGKVQATVHLPSSSGNQYYLNPSEFNQSSSLTGNTIQATTTSISSGNYYELQVTMPLKDFNNAVYAKKDNRNALGEIQQKQTDYKNNEIFYGNLFNIISILCFISPILPIGVYIKYGRDPKTNYNGIYERDLPTKDPPAMINALIENSDLGTPDMKGFEATIMDLIDRKVLNLNVEDTDKPDKKNLYISINKEKTSNLDLHEKDIINIFTTFADEEGQVNLNDFQNKLYDTQNGIWFKEKYELWQNDFKYQYLNNEIFAKYFEDKGSNLFKIIGIIGMILGFIIAIISLMSIYSASLTTVSAASFMFVVSIVCMLAPAKIGGRWTVYGKEFNEKWKNFRKFLKDNSLIKKYPPESIIIWNQYLVYGTALGVADKVHKAMKMNLYAENNLYDPYDNNMYLFHSYGGLILLDNAFNTGITTATSDDSDFGIGDIGGGSGGGGGGAF